MAMLLMVLSIAGSILLTPFLMLLVCIIFLASIGKSLGVRRLYVKTLLMIFEYGRKDIESSLNHRNKEVPEDIDEGYSEEITQSEKSAEEPPLANGLVNGGNNVISRDEGLIFVPEPPTSKTEEAVKEEKFKDYELSNVFEYVKAGVEAIIEDQVTSRFEAEELKNWNLLIRTNRGYEFISWKLTFLWLGGFFIRYFFLFPLRLIICCFGVFWLTLCTALVGYVKPGEFKTSINKYVSIMCFGILSRAISSVITYHNEENKPKNGICVANHTSPIDVLILMCDNCYSLIGQRHGGFLGIFQRALARASPHIWFERSETRDRSAVANRLKEHVSNPKNPPILIFPEGTCINNTSVMQFKKGSFEVGSVIYPVAIKYDPRFGDAFWNSSRFSMVQYLYMMMTSWAIVCDVWYLPPMYQRENESAIDFANRVKSVIAKQGGLVDLVWDGGLKRVKAKKEWKERQQEEFSRRLKAE
ncbi:glycerol-3-phosphate acyltransferase 4 isoform X2 [Diabrotica virgifera virgifera]|uniref:Phospholipid/glycerol acyltransferase domain-containing protein n=1 Tax=Diabrotica virgifera virgifera TaxID=50390 RepID=A0ABM5K6J4_DIAVI|nr:glycerol-3-phosphate acyltransferase 4 isoform X2 [Diabrotica virgifera virgifera]